MKKRLLSLTLIAALCLSLFPTGTAPALAASEGAPETLIVGGTDVKNGNYWTTGTDGKLTSGSENSWNVRYDANSNTLILNDATITGVYSENAQYNTVGIYAGSSGDVSLEIKLQGENTITSGGYGIWVYSPDQGGAATLNITGENGGSLDASGSVNPGILVQSNSGGATLSIQSADVTAASTSSNGVQVRSGANKSASLTVDGGSLTASGNPGICFDFGNESYSDTASLTVGGNALVDTRNGGIDVYGTGDLTPTVPTGAASGGIVFNSNEGIVYGNVTLQKDLTIGEGERLDIPSGASLTIGNGATLTVNGGELTGENIPTEGVVYKVTEVTLSQSILTLDVGDAATLTATVTPTNATNQNVTWESSDSNGIVTISPDTADSKKATITATGAGTTTIKATVDGKSAECSVTVKAPTTIPVTGVSLNTNTLDLTEGDTSALTATITPNNATNKNVTWSSDNETVATVSNGLVTAMKAGTATITVAATDGSGVSATCTVTVNAATTITTQPQSVSVTEGQSATFSVTATGDNLRYQWQINSGNGWSDITGATDASYTIDRTTTAMSGNQYCCVVTGDGGETTSSAATLTVRPYEPPYNGKYSYEIVSDVGENGTIDVDRYATEGDQVTITVSPDEAYLLDDLTVTSGGKDVALTDNGDGTYSFTMPSGDVAITATFAEDPNWEDPADPATDVSEIFTDVPANHWAQAAIQYVYDNGLMTGVSDTTFAPEATTTRAMIVSMLARMENVTSAADAGFTDVTASDWYATAVNWAAANGIVSGIGDNTFAPNAPITREQLAAMLMNYAQWKGQDISARADLSDYTDAPSTWASEAVQWAVAEGLLAGVTDDQLQPQGQATRAQVAAIFERFLEA